MSESLKSWLFSHCSTSACTALSGNFDLSDLPFLPGNRIQLLRFLTFLASRSSSSSTHSDIWALVGDRTHCIAARFDFNRISRFHADYPLSFTSLKGALVSLTHVRITVARVKIDPGLAGGVVGGYRNGQWGLVLDVRGWKVVSSVAEPVWFGRVKLVTSPNAVPVGEEEKGKRMMLFLSKWVRFENMQIRAERERDRMQRLERESEGESEGAGNGGNGVGGSGRGGFPTPAQRRRRQVLVASSRQVQNSQPPSKSQVGAGKGKGKGKERQVFQSSQAHSQEGAMFVTPTTTTKETEALWNDFDLDAAVDVDIDDIDVPQLWSAASAIATVESTTEIQASESAPAATQTIIPVQSPTQPEAQFGIPTQSPSQDLDPDESGLSDYERKTRLGRRACKRTHHPPRSGTLSAASSCVDDTGLEPKCLELKYLSPSFPMLSGLPEAEMQAEMQKSTIEIACNSKGTPDRTKITHHAVEVDKRKLWQEYRLRRTPRVQPDVASVLAVDQHTSKTVQSKTVQSKTVQPRSVLDTARSPRRTSTSTASNKIKNKKRQEAIAAL
ncbi:uncharacterized protein UDID_06667 [Ustilago sp. UG-2017a]|nr:uncharacterized protein UDID_06667 [Ustilago sp. UG-2017a]